MNGPEHYREAERLIAAADRLDDFPSEEYAQLVATAQAHAALAGVAAAMHLQLGMASQRDPAWRKALGIPEP